MSVPENILIFRPGQLGDSIVALPALWAVREAYPEAKITWLHDKQTDKTLLSPKDLLNGNNELIQSYIEYPFYPSSISNVFARLNLFNTLRALKFDTLCYLPPSSRSIKHRQRDIKFFAATGIKHVLGASLGTQDYTNWREADIFLKSIDSNQTPFKGQNRGKMALPTSSLKCETPIVEKNTLAVFIGSNFKDKEFPLHRWAPLLNDLLSQHNLSPLFLGDEGHASDADIIIGELHQGQNACGEYSIAQTISALTSCSYCIAVDSGGTHLASLAQCPTLVLSHGLSEPGRWDPYGNGHKVLRAKIPGLTSSIPDEKILAEFQQMLNS